MSRLRHDVKAYIVAFRMTRSETIVFAEGTENDPVFYEAIVTRYEAETGRKTEFRAATELPNAAKPARGGSGGKETLLKASSFVRRWRAGIGHAVRGKEIAFCVDKDIDDLLGLASPPPLIYTRLHSVENHLVLSADIHRAIANALSVTVESVKSQLPTPQNLLALSENWRDWVTFSILALRLPCRSPRGYGQPSPINSPAHVAADPNLADHQFISLRKAATCDLAIFNAELHNASDLVNRLIASGRFDEVFKGKWYIDIFFSLCQSCQGLKDRCKKAGKNELWVGIRGSFVLSERDYQQYKTGFEGSRI